MNAHSTTVIHSIMLVLCFRADKYLRVLNRMPVMKPTFETDKTQETMMTYHWDSYRYHLKEVSFQF